MEGVRRSSGSVKSHCDSASRRSSSGRAGGARCGEGWGDWWVWFVGEM